MKQKRIGLYGGTFDPPHNGHLDLALWVLSNLQLDCIYFIPTAKHALKANEKITPIEIRWNMLTTAIKDEDSFFASRIEIDRPDISYTVDTLENFQNYENLPGAEMFYIIGSDNLSEFHLWKEPQRILNIARVVVLRRQNSAISAESEEYTRQMIMLRSPYTPVSSSLIRQNVKTGKSVVSHLRPNVMDIIEQEQLYRK